MHSNIYVLLQLTVTITLSTRSYVYTKHRILDISATQEHEFHAKVKQHHLYGEHNRECTGSSHQNATLRKSMEKFYHCFVIFLCLFYLFFHIYLYIHMLDNKSLTKDSLAWPFWNAFWCDPPITRYKDLPDLLYLLHSNLYSTLQVKPGYKYYL